MGQKVNPIGLRIGIIEDWRSRWFAGKEYASYLKEDIYIREFIHKSIPRASISKIEIERKGDSVKLDIYTSRPGVVIGRKGSEVETLRKFLEEKTSKKIQINIQEVKRPELNAVLIAQNVAEQIEARVSYRRAMKRAMNIATRAGAKGIKIKVSGRLGGAEMARTEWYHQGRVPLHTLRSKIDYGTHEALTKFGRIGIKVWVYLGDILPEIKKELEREGEKEE